MRQGTDNLGTDGNEGDDLKRGGTTGDYTQDDMGGEDKNDADYNGGRGEDEVEENMRS